MGLQLKVKNMQPTISIVPTIYKQLGFNSTFYYLGNCPALATIKAPQQAQPIAKLYTPLKVRVMAFKQSGYTVLPQAFATSYCKGLAVHCYPYVGQAIAPASPLAKYL